MSAVADGVGRAVCALTRAEGARAWERGGRAAHTPSIADGTALHRGRVGSRHFQSPRGFFPEGSLFVSLRATGYLLTRAACLLSVRLKKCRNKETTARREVYRTPYWGKEKIVRLLGK